MTIRQDNSTPINLPSIEKFKNKTEIRNFLMWQWINENPQTKYRYFVETLIDGSKIYLERPGRLNKGCDFVIYVENAYLWNNENDRPPDHDFVLNDISRKKKKMSKEQWNSFLLAVDEIYNTRPFANAIPLINDLPIVGYPYDLILKLIRWFFIEQDITYWSGQGREMFYEAINDL